MSHNSKTRGPLPLKYRVNSGSTAMTGNTNSNRRLGNTL